MSGGNRRLKLFAAPPSCAGVVPGPDNKSRVRSSSAGVSRAKTPQPGYQALAITHTTPAPVARNDNNVGMSASRGGQLQLSNPPPSMAAAAAVYGTTQRPQSAPKWRIRPTADATGTTFANSAFKSGNGPALAWGNGGGNSDSPSAMLAGGSNSQQARWLARSGSDPAATVATFTSSAGGSDPWSSIGSSHLHNSTGNQRGLPASPLLATGSNGSSQGGLSRGMHGTTFSSTSTTSSPYISLSSTAANNNKASVQQQQQHGSNSSSSNATRYAWEVSTSPSQPQQQHRAGAAAAPSSSLLPQAVSPTSRQPPAAALPSTAASAAPMVGRPRTAQGGPVAAVALPRVDQHPQQHHQQFVAGQQPIGNSGVIRTAAGADGAPSQHNSAAAQLLHHQHHINSNASNRMPTSSGPSAGAVADRLAGLPAGRPMQQVAGNANHAQHGGNAGNAMFGGGGDDDDDSQMNGDDGGGGGLFNGHQHHHGGAAAAASGRAASRPSSAAAQQQPQPHQHQLFSNIAGSNNIGIGNLALPLSHASNNNNNPNSSNPYGGGGGVGVAGGMPITGIDISSLPSDEQDAQRKALQRQLQREREWLARQKLKQTVAMPDFDARATTDFYGFGKVLGQGSFGEVRLAWHRLAGQKVAIKSYEKSKLTEPNHWRRVQQEIRLMERLNHPHIIRELEMIDSPKRIHIVMEYAGGGNLCSYVKAKARLGEGEARKIFLQLLAAVEYMHENGIIHRDIKLENVLFDEDQSNVKLTDFGFSVMVRDPMKRLKIFCGTPSYMAPEITQRREYLGRPVDVWSLAVLLYACLAGHFPFTAKTYPELYKKIAAAQVKFPDHISAAVKDLLRRMLHPDPMKRLTLAHARMHPWVAPSLSLIMMSINAPADNSLLVSDDPTRDVNEAVLQRCEQLGFKRQRVLEAVLGRVKNACSTTYYLVLARAGRSAKAVPSSSSTAPAGTHGVAQGGVTGGGAANQQQGIGAQMLAMQQQQYQQQQQQQLMPQRPATAAPGVGGSGGAGGLRGGRQPAATGSASGGGAIALLPPSTNMPINSHHHQQQQYLSSYAVAATGLAQGSDGMEVAAMLNNQHLRGAGAGSNNNVGHGTGFASAGYSHLTSEGSSSQGGSTASHYLSSPSAAAGSGAPTSAWRASASGPSSGVHSQHARPGSASRPITNGLSSGLTAGNVAILTSTTSSTNNHSTSERTGHAGAGAHGILGMGPEDSQESDGMDAGGGPMMVSGAGKGLRPMAGGNYSNHDGGGGGQQQRSRSAAPASRPRSAMPLGRQAGAVALQATGATTGGGVTTSAGLTFGYAQGNPAVAMRRPSIGSSNYSNNGDMFINTSAQARQPPLVASNDTSSSNGGRGPMTVTSWSPSKALGQQAAAGAPAAQASQQQQRSSSPTNAQRSGAAAGTAGGGAATMLSQQQQQRQSSESRTSSGATAAQPALPAAPAAATHAIMRSASASRPLARPGSASSSASSSASAGSTSAAATSSLPHDHRPTVIDIASLTSVLSAEAAAAAAAASNAAGAGAHRSPIMQQQQVKPSNTSSSAQQQQQQQQQPLSFLDRIAAQQQQQARSGSSGMDASGGGAASSGASGAHLYANSSNGSGNGKGTTSFSPKASSSGGGTLQQQQPTSPTHHNSGSGSGPIRGPSALLGSPLVMPQQYNHYHQHQQQQYQDYSSSNSGSGAGHVHSNAAQAAAAHNLAAAALQHGAGSSSGHVGPVRPIRPTSASSQAGRLL